MPQRKCRDTEDRVTDKVKVRLKNLIEQFNDNHNVGTGMLTVTGPYKVKVFDGCGSHYGVAMELDKGVVICIDRIAPSENSRSIFGHVSHVVHPDKGVSVTKTANWWISLASNNLTPDSYTKPVNKYIDTDGYNF